MVIGWVFGRWVQVSKYPASLAWPYVPCRAYRSLKARHPGSPLRYI